MTCTAPLLLGCRGRLVHLWSPARTPISQAPFLHLAGKRLVHRAGGSFVAAAAAAYQGGGRPQRGGGVAGGRSGSSRARGRGRSAQPFRDRPRPADGPRLQDSNSASAGDGDFRNSSRSSSNSSFRDPSATSSDNIRGASGGFRGGRAGRAARGSSDESWNRSSRGSQRGGREPGERRPMGWGQAAPSDQDDASNSFSRRPSTVSESQASFSGRKPEAPVDAYQARFGPVPAVDQSSRPDNGSAADQPASYANSSRTAPRDWSQSVNGRGARETFSSRSEQETGRDWSGSSSGSYGRGGRQTSNWREREGGNAAGNGWRGTSQGSSQGRGRWQSERSWQQPSSIWNGDADEGSSNRIEVEGEVVYGVSPVLAAFAAQRRTIHTLFIQEGLGKVQGEGRRKERGAPEHAIEAAQAAGATVSHISKHDLNMLTDNRPHQGLALDCSSLDWEQLDEMPEIAMSAGETIPIWLALDEVTDPHNFGAVLRSAFFLGASGVMASQKNCAPLSAAVSKASAGAMEAVRVHACPNLPRTLSEAAAKGWAVLGASAEAESEDCSAVAVSKPTVLVVGSEGYGLRTTVRRACTGFVKVAGGPEAAASSSVPDSEVDSLNVSVATGILLHQLLQSATSSGQK